MRKFYVLLKKEIKELLTVQMLVPFLIGILAFVLIGKIAGGEAKKTQAPQNIAIVDLDNSSMSKNLKKVLSENNFIINEYSNIDLNKALIEAKQKNANIGFQIPKDFENQLLQGKSPTIEFVSIIKNFSAMGSVSTRSISTVKALIGSTISDLLITKKVANIDTKFIKEPVNQVEFVQIGDNIAKANASDISGFITSQTAFIPVILFLVIIMSAQMIGVAIASEKENKTLETLLSTPISRISLVFAKMTAAGLVSIMLAAVYMIGYRNFMNGLIGDNAKELFNPQMAEAIKNLGLEIGTTGYLLLGTNLFLSILIALSIAIILGAFADDAKKAQGLIAPLTFLIMIPYFLVMFLDISTASTSIKILTYIIPFSHTFLSAPNIFIKNYNVIIYGIIYQAFVFIVFLTIAARIFSTDKILTMKLDFKKRSLLRR